jgi:hypothetical protein
VQSCFNLLTLLRGCWLDAGWRCSTAHQELRVRYTLEICKRALQEQTNCTEAHLSVPLVKYPHPLPLGKTKNRARLGFQGSPGPSEIKRRRNLPSLVDQRRLPFLLSLAPFRWLVPHYPVRMASIWVFYKSICEYVFPFFPIWLSEGEASII